ncbi:MAG: M43 family zinc metalloprotease [Flavobacteriales bacterium]
MKRLRFIGAIGALLIAGATNAQHQHDKNHEWCSSHHLLQEELERNPSQKEVYEQFLKDLTNYQAINKGKVKSGNKKIIPVVVHVLHDGGPENISKAQILDQIRILNEDFNAMSQNANLTPAPFQPLVANCEYEFRLANRDPLGNCTDGIVRVFTNKTNGASNANGAKGVSYWNSFSYLNIWVVKNIGDTNPLGTILGYAQFPGGGIAQTDGIVVIHNYFGSIGTAAGRRGSTTTHEIGHWLGLRHIWGDGVCVSDGVEDTPPHQGPNFGVCWNNFPHNVGGCIPAADNPHGEMFMNYMDYSDDVCMSMFTIGQKEVMDFVLEGFTGSDGFRSFLVSEQNLMATGVSDNFNQTPCAPIAEFNQNRDMICAGSTVTFTDNSFNGTVSSREWSFDGGTPATATTATATVTYNNPGRFRTTLTASNDIGSNTIVKEQIVTVSPTSTSLAGNPQENFQNEAFFNENWMIRNLDNTANKWERVPVGFDDNASVRMVNFGNVRSEVDMLISPAYNLSGFSTPITLNFKLAGAERGFTPDDRLVVSVSNNCGQTWQQRASIQGWQLNTAGTFTSFFTPTHQGQWRDVFVTLPASNNDNMRIRFEYVRGTTAFNNVYIDNINIGTALGVLNPEQEIGLHIFPNPTNDFTQVSFLMEKPKQVNMSLYDISGREVMKIFKGMSGTGEQLMQLNMNHLDAGIYMLNMIVDGQLISKKIIKR